MIRRLAQIALMGVLVLVSLAAAQQEPQPVARLGNYIEVGNDVWLHILATADFRYRTVENYDFERRVRDRTPSRNPSDSTTQEGELDGTWALLRFGVDFRYQKSLTMQLVGEQRAILDGNTTDDRSNSTNPGGTDVFGRATSTENPGYHFKYAWLEYKFIGTPLRMRVGFDLWRQDQAGLIGDNDPRFALFGEFGDIDVMAAAVIQYESQRLGLVNDNDLIYYTFSAGYNFKPHRFQFDVTYMRDRFAGADRGSFALSPGDLAGFPGQKTDSVLIMPSWTGAIGPIRGLLEGALVTGTARGGVTGIPTGPGANIPGRNYSILAGAVVGLVEADLGIVRPYVMAVYGSGDGDPTDRKLHGFNPTSWNEITLMTNTSWFSFLETSQAIGVRDYSCPARFQGVRTTAPAGNPLAVGTAVASAAGGSTASGFNQCGHSVGNPFNNRLGNTSTLGIFTPYANPGTLMVPVGLKAFPLKGHELTGWYIYRGMVNSHALRIAFAPELAGRRIRTTQYHEVGGFWLWTLNPNFDIRVSGNVGIPGSGWKDLARLSDCDLTTAGVRPCSGKNLALTGEARFRARS